MEESFEDSTRGYSVVVVSLLVIAMVALLVITHGYIWTANSSARNSARSAAEVFAARFGAQLKNNPSSEPATSHLVAEIAIVNASRTSDALSMVAVSTVKKGSMFGGATLFSTCFIIKYKQPGTSKQEYVINDYQSCRYADG